MELGLAKKTFVLIFLAALLYAAFLATNSLAVMADAAYSLVDALFVFSLWLSLVLVSKGALTRTSVRLVSASVFLLSLLLVFSSALILYSSFLALKVGHKVTHPEYVLAAELLFVFILFYVYVSLREEALEEDVSALVVISRDVERNILSSMLVMVAALFSMAGLHAMDSVVAIFISAYVLYRSLVLSYHSFRSSFGFSDPVIVDMVLERVRNAGAKVVSIEVLGIGPYYYVDLTVDASPLPDPWERVEEILRRRIEAVLPASAKVRIRHPGGGI